MTLESLARTIAKARHGTDVMWPNFMGAAEAVRDAFGEVIDRRLIEQLFGASKLTGNELRAIDPTRFPFNEADRF